MNIHSILGLGMALAVPALVQTVQAQEVSKAQQAVQGLFAVAGGYAEILGLVQAGEASPEEAAKGILELKKMADQVMANIDALTDEEKAEAAAIMEDKEIAEAYAQVEEGLKLIEEGLKANNYFDSPALKAACEAFNAN